MNNIQSKKSKDNKQIKGFIDLEDEINKLFSKQSKFARKVEKSKTQKDGTSNK